ncbi:hypothetical protein [Motilimonas sp. KMU-193]|uniref:hypothetical protein n=1 Tax=Motilimonas sp. KMU-193 TaxID=3388668 RepID=UPI00396B483A
MSKAHGKAEVKLVNHIIYCKLSGSFNDLGCRQYTQQVKQCITTLNEQPFAMLIDDLELEGGTPEAYEQLQAYNEWLTTQAIIAKAFIIKNKATQQIILQRSPALLAQNIAFFQQYDDAVHWLEQALALHL